MAETAEIAQQALALIRVDYEALPAVTDPRDALQPDAPQLHPDRPNREPCSSISRYVRVRWSRGFADADIIIERTYRTADDRAWPSWSRNARWAVPAGYSGSRPSTSKEPGRFRPR